MADKIGHLLIQKGKITPAQLKEALRTQQFFGGYLGSHLVNLGYIDETTLGEALAETHRVPFAPFETIRLAQKEAVQRVPAQLAQRHRAIPFRIDEGTLHVAMLNPKDTVALNEIAQASGLAVVPWVAPESRIMQALERHYRIRREGRGPIALKPEPAAPGQSATPSPHPANAAASPSAVATPEAPSDEPAFGFDGLPLDAALRPEFGGSERPRTGGPVPRSLEEWLDMTEEESGPSSRDRGRSRPSARADREQPPPRDRGFVPAGPSRMAPRPPAPPSHLPIPAELEPLRAPLAGIASRDDLGRLLCTHLASRFKRAAAFSVRGGRILGWTASGEQIDPARVAQIDMAGDTASFFAPVVAASVPYVGPVPATTSADGFYELLGGPVATSILLVPVSVKGRLMTILYADNLDAPIGTVDILVQKGLAELAALGLELLIVRNRILKG